MSTLPPSINPAVAATVALALRGVGTPNVGEASRAVFNALAPFLDAAINRADLCGYSRGYTEALEDADLSGRK